MTGQEDGRQLQLVLFPFQAKMNRCVQCQSPPKMKKIESGENKVTKKCINFKKLVPT